MDFHQISTFSFAQSIMINLEYKFQGQFFEFILLMASI